MANKKIFLLETRLMFMSDLNYSFFFFLLYPLEKYFIRTI